MLFCPLEGCKFAYSEDQPNLLKTHKGRAHVTTVKVVYHNLTEEAILHRTADSFQCLHCKHSTQYLTGIQVRYYFTLNCDRSAYRFNNPSDMQRVVMGLNLHQKSIFTPYHQLNTHLLFPLLTFQFLS